MWYLREGKLRCVAAVWRQAGECRRRTPRPMAVRHETKEVHMNQSMKRIKIACIADLIVGVVTVVLGVIAIVSNPLSVSHYMLTLVGVTGAYLGLRGSIWANVPSNAKRIRDTSSVMVLVEFVASIFVVMPPVRADRNTVYMILVLLVLALALVSFANARQVVAAQKAK